MLSLKIAIAGGIAGILANVTGYLITGRAFHPYQARTPETWRKTESWKHYVSATAIRIAACMAIAGIYSIVGGDVPAFAGGPIPRALSLGTLLWAALAVPLVCEVAVFVNWHRGFVVGLLLDWLIVCNLATCLAALATGSV